MDLETKGSGEFEDDLGFWFEHVEWMVLKEPSFLLLSERTLWWEDIWGRNHMSGFGHQSSKCLQSHQAKRSNIQLDMLI